MTLTIELTPDQQAALEAEAASQGTTLPEFARLRLLDTLPQQKTWGQNAIERWRQARVLGEYGDMTKDCLEYAGELRARIEADLFGEEADAA